MQLLKLKDVQLSVQDRIFKESALMQFLAGLVFAALAIGILLWNRIGDLSFVAVIFPGSFFVLFSVISFRIFKKTLAPANWLVAIGPDRIFIKFRSYLNSHLPADDPQVISLTFSEIEAAQITKKKIKYRGSKNTPTTEYLTYLDLSVKTENLQPLQERLKFERTTKVSKDLGGCKYSSKAQHYPVSVPADKIIRIQWRRPSSHIVPNIRKAVDLLERQRVVIRPVQRETCDYTAGSVRNEAKPDDKILELAEKGNIIAATRLAQQVYDYDTTQAREFVNSLLQ